MVSSGAAPVQQLASISWVKAVTSDALICVMPGITACGEGPGSSTFVFVVDMDELSRLHVSGPDTGGQPLFDGRKCLLSHGMTHTCGSDPRLHPILPPNEALHQSTPHRQFACPLGCHIQAHCHSSSNEQKLPVPCTYEFRWLCLCMQHSSRRLTCEAWPSATSTPDITDATCEPAPASSQPCPGAASGQLQRDASISLG